MAKVTQQLVQLHIAIKQSEDLVEGFLDAIRNALLGIDNPTIRSVIPSGDRKWVLTLRVPEPPADSNTKDQT